MEEWGKLALVNMVTLAHLDSCYVERCEFLPAEGAAVGAL